MSSPTPGLTESLRALSALAVGAARTRVRLAQAELQAEKDRLLRHMALMLATLFLGAFGFFLFVMWLVWLVPVEWRTHVMGAASLVFVAAAAASWWRLQREAQDGPALMDATLQVLDDDLAAVGGAGRTP